MHILNFVVDAVCAGTIPLISKAPMEQHCAIIRMPRAACESKTCANRPEGSGKERTAEAVSHKQAQLILYTTVLFVPTPLLWCILCFTTGAI